MFHIPITSLLNIIPQRVFLASSDWLLAVGVASMVCYLAMALGFFGKRFMSWGPFGSSRTFEKLPFVIILAFFALVFLPMIITVNLDRSKAYSNFLSGRKAEAVRFRIPTADVSATVKDQAKIDLFFNIIDRAHSVAAHHSSPQNLIFISFNSEDHEYALGHHSSVENEYWLSDETQNLHLKQFRSLELSEWLRSSKLWFAEKP